MLYRQLSLSFLLLFSVQQFVLGTECIETLFKVIPTQKLHRSYLKIGDLVEIHEKNENPRTAIFVGMTNDDIYFTSIETANLKRPAFYLSRSEAELVTEPSLANPTVLSRPLTGEMIPTIFGAVGENLCAPHSVFGCLEHLDRKGALPEDAKMKLHHHPQRLFQDLVNSFSRKTISETQQAQAILKDLKNARGRKDRNDFIKKMRALGFDRITAMLSNLKVKSQVTGSYGRLIRHLKSEQPAYISVSAALVSTTQPHLNDWRQELPWDHKDISSGTFPVPRWAPSYAGFHAVYAFAVLPRAPGIAGFLRGHRILVLDSNNGKMNIWNTGPLRFAGTAQFILIGSDN